MTDRLAGVFEFVVEHNVLVLVALLVLTAGVGAGVTQLRVDDGSGGESELDSAVGQKLEYLRANYGAGDEETRVVPATVYVRTDDALSKPALVATLEYQRTVLSDPAVADSLADRGVVSVANVIGKRAAGSPDATRAEQLAALRAASPEEVDRLVRRTLTADSAALSLLPADYEPGTTTAESHRVVFYVTAEDGEVPTDTAQVLYDTAEDPQTVAGSQIAVDGQTPEFFTLGEHAREEIQRQSQANVMELILPAALLVILLVLAVAYRDLVDVIVGFTGVALSVLWMFGILGWLQIPARLTLIVGPVLIVGLSVDYGLHVFTRYREERGADTATREPMVRSLSSVGGALGLVTVTTGVGFLSNVASGFTPIRRLAIGITLGVGATFLLSVTLVPALKLTVDHLLARVGLDRHATPLGETRLLRPVLQSGVRLARHAAPLVLALALVGGAAGGVAWTDLDRQAWQQDTDGVAEWKEELPGPLAWEYSEAREHSRYVDEHYRAADESDRSRSSVLFEGSVATPAALERVQAVQTAAGDAEIAFARDGDVPTRSPVSVMRRVAARDESFATTLADADTDGDGVPERNVAGVYDALFATAPDAASRVIDREDGTYRSLRVVVPVRADVTVADTADGMQRIAAAGRTADAVESTTAAPPVEITAVGRGTVNEAEANQTAANILQTLVVALAAVAGLLVVVYRVTAGSATLGLATALPIAVVAALVVGGMWVLAVPLTPLTALLLSLVIGLGIDYNIHVSDRFVDEVADGHDVWDALDTAATGTGGALLGSTLTSTGAFSALLLHPHPQLQSFGTLVVLALALSFVVALFVLPSLLALWARYVPGGVDAATESPAVAPSDD